jgi:predicted site-specific integrase-resolvase
MKISEVSELSGLTTDTLRYYKKIGLILPVNRNGSGMIDINDMTRLRGQVSSIKLIGE